MSQKIYVVRTQEFIVLLIILHYSNLLYSCSLDNVFKTEPSKQIQRLVVYSHLVHALM
jgi:hypothetical protein